MSGPPKGAEPSELWLALSERPRPTMVIDFPSRNPEASPGKLALRVLTESELHTCRANAEKTARQFLADGAEKADGNGLGFEDVYRNELLVQLTCMAARRVDNPLLPVFMTPAAARKVLTTDELGILVATYNAFRVETSPLVSEQTPAEMEAWIRVLKEGGSRLPLARLSGEAQSDLVMYLVSKMAPSPTASGSAGSPPDGPSTETPSQGSDLVDADERGRT